MRIAHRRIALFVGKVDRRRISARPKRGFHQVRPRLAYCNHPFQWVRCKSDRKSTFAQFGKLGRIDVERVCGIERNAPSSARAWPVLVSGISTLVVEGPDGSGDLERNDRRRTGYRIPVCARSGRSPGFADSGMSAPISPYARTRSDSFDHAQRLIRIRGSSRGDPDPSGFGSQGGP